MHRSGLALNVARVSPEAPVRLRPVLAHGRVAGAGPRRGLETVTSMCRRVGGTVCVNGDFATCSTCREPMGGVVVDGVPVRSFVAHHAQFSAVPGEGSGFTSRPVRWSGQLTATFTWHGEPSDDSGGGDRDGGTGGGDRDGEDRDGGVLGLGVEGGTGSEHRGLGAATGRRRATASARPRSRGAGAPSSGDGGGTGRTETRTLALAGLNIAAPGAHPVLSTSRWGPSSPGGADAALVLDVSGPLRPGSAAASPVALRRDGSPVPLPPGRAVVSARGAGGEDIEAFWREWQRSGADERRLEIRTALSAPVEQSLGGHPVLLADGRTMPLDPEDDKVTRRHPRTLVAWNGDGSLLLVTIDGREPGRREGVTLGQAADLLRELGATDAVNLDGGGSSTFVAPCPEGPCAVNEPSEGRERAVTTALAVVSEGTPALAAGAPTRPRPAPAPAPAPPEPKPSPPSTARPAEPEAAPRNAAPRARRPSGPELAPPPPARAFAARHPVGGSAPAGPPLGLVGLAAGLLAAGAGGLVLVARPRPPRRSARR